MTKNDTAEMIIIFFQNLLPLENRRHPNPIPWGLIQVYPEDANLGHYIAYRDVYQAISILFYHNNKLRYSSFNSNSFDI